LAVTGADGEALEIIRRRARRVGAPLTAVDPAPVLGWDRDGLDVELTRLGPTRIGLRGRHQAANVAVADAMLDALEAAGIARADVEARRAGYGAATWPGRLELVEVDGTEVLLDGAHNPAGAAALAQALDDLRPYLAPGPLSLVVASMADKDVEGVVDALGGAGALRGATIIATTVEAVRALPADDLAALWRLRDGGVADILVREDPIDALETALETARKRSGATVVAGSLYLVGAVRAHLIDDPELRDPPGP
jgi:dihydrofolate synthase/folylpolyglutamate synthase